MSPIDKLQALLGAATPGPWDNRFAGTIGRSDVCPAQSSSKGRFTTTSTNAELIVALVNAAPELLAVVRAVKAYNDCTDCEDMDELWFRTQDKLEALDKRLEQLG